MSKHIGIVGCSAEGAALCFRAICSEGAARLGPHAHPEVSLHTFPLSEYMKCIDPGDWLCVSSMMLDSARRLASIGAQILICPDNTIHQAMDHVVPHSPAPWLHIAEVVVQQAKAQGFRNLAITGTKYLMEGPVYAQQCGAAGIGHQIPHDNERARINQIIFDELVYGVIRHESRAYFHLVIERMKNEGCDAVVLGCTEIPLLVLPEGSPLPTLDSTRLLARAALDYSIGA